MLGHTVKRITNPMHEHEVTANLSRELVDDLAAMLTGAKASILVSSFVADLIRVRNGK